MTVNVLTDDPDLNPSDGNCDSDSAPGNQCSLRAAIETANSNSGFLDTIQFAASLSGPITLGPAFPALSDTAGTKIIGPSNHAVVIAGANQACLVLSAGTGNEIRNLVINGCSGHGIAVSGSSGGNTIANNYIGTDATGNAGAGNVGDGINVGGTGGNTITGNVIGNNGSPTGDGIHLSSPNNVVRGNSIGLGANGVAILGNKGDGIENAFAGNNTIGGTGAGQGNTIAHNTGAAVNVSAGTAGIRHNRMFLNTSLGIDNAPGTPPAITVYTFNGSTFVVGGTAPAFNTVEVFQKA